MGYGVFQQLELTVNYRSSPISKPFNSTKSQTIMSGRSMGKLVINIALEKFTIILGAQFQELTGLK